MKQKHTPGPWEQRGGTPDYTAGNRGKTIPHHVIVVDRVAGCKRVRFVAACEGANLDNEANARLIAAAPEMLAALQAMVQSAHPHPTEHPTMTKAWAVARAAIAKATAAHPPEGEKEEG